ncbi:MAG: magnesium protoporphyrin IX methyltransferase, partial [Cyanobacteria bacterium J06636_28]
EASVRAQATLPPEALPNFTAQDLETLDGRYHTVICLDVLIHYPQEKAGDMIAHLSSLAEERLILSFAPKNAFYTVLKRIGEFFPGPSKATRAYLHSEADIRAALKANGWQIKRKEFTATQFYFSRLVEAVRVAD